MSLRIRYPGWADRGMKVIVNGEPFAHDAKPGSFVSISRTWKTGDRVEVKLPIKSSPAPMPDNATRTAICYGPVVLAGELGTEGIVPPMPYAIKQSDFFNVKPPPMPVLLAGRRPVGDWVEPVPGKPLTFRTKGVGSPADITLVALYALAPGRYSLYWDIFTAEEWKLHQAMEERQSQRNRDLSKRTVDAAGIGDAASERAHNLKSENGSKGTFSTGLIVPRTVAAGSPST